MKLVILTAALLATGLVAAHPHSVKTDGVSGLNDTQEHRSVSGAEAERDKNRRSGDKPNSAGDQDRPDNIDIQNRPAGKPVITIIRLHPGQHEGKNSIVGTNYTGQQ